MYTTGVVMSKTHIDIDEDLLAQVARITGTTTKRETVEAALRATLRQDRRRAAVERLVARGHAGYFGALLSDHPKPPGRQDGDAATAGDGDQGAA